MLRKRLSAKAQQVVMVIVVIVLTLAFAVGPQATTFACEGAPGNCPCPGCG